MLQSTKSKTIQLLAGKEPRPNTVTATALSVLKDGMTLEEGAAAIKAACPTYGKSPRLRRPATPPPDYGYRVLRELRTYSYVTW